MLNTYFAMNGSTLTVRPTGELDSMTSPVFEKEFRQNLTGAGSVIVDFEEVN